MHRQNTALWPKAHERLAARRHRRGGRLHIQMTSRRGGGTPAIPEVREETVRFWWAPPDRLREEVASNMPGGTRTVILNDDLWWLFGDAIGAITNELLDEEARVNHHAGGGDQFRPMLDPSWLIPALEIDSIRAGDGLLHVDGRLRDDLEGPRLFHLHLVGGADRFELDVDAELGIVRAMTSYLDEDELSSLRFDDLVLGELLADDLFTRPAGIDFDPAGERTGPTTLEEAVAEAPFPVFYVPDLPDGVWRLHLHCSRRPRFSVGLMYHRSDGRESFSLMQSEESVFEPEGEHVERDGTIYVIGERCIAFERDRTKLMLQSDSLDGDALLDVAASLRRFAND